MTSQLTIDESARGSTGESARERLLAGVPVSQQRLQLAGISTALLRGGNGPPVVLLHGPGGNATHWFRIIPDLVTTHAVTVPDLPGQGQSRAPDAPLDADGVLAWLGELIEQTCPSPPAVVGYAFGGAIAARFASRRSDSVGRLVLVDTLGLAPFEPVPEFGAALHEFLAAPTEVTHDHLWQECTLDLRSVRSRMGDLWKSLEAYNLDRARTPSVMATLGTMMEQFGLPAIPPADLERITAPTTLIWGRHDRATPIRVAEAASARYGWPLHVIENSGTDPAIEEPEEFMRALRSALESR